MNKELKINCGDKSFTVSFDKNTTLSGETDGKTFTWDVQQIKENSFHVLKDNRSLNVELLKADYRSKVFKIKINGVIHDVSIEDKYDQLLKSLGIASGAGEKISELKAPMPGMVLEVMVEEGQLIQKGEPLLVLEAMKMENVLKSPGDVEVKKVKIEKGKPVEKNEVLIQFK